MSRTKINISREQESHMRWAIALALEGQGKTSPNPVVGAVIVKNGQVIGEGYHRMAGSPHAEIHALKQAGEGAQGADLFVTLEPCCHHGRTPPCTDAIITAGIRRVFIGQRDPNPIVSGRGIKALRASGVEIVEDVLLDSCIAINEAYSKHIATGLPLVIAKVALTLDGKIATKNGDSKWITSAECREYVHRLRAKVDAVMVGGGTVRTDDPRLTVRIPKWGGMQPQAIVVDEKLRFDRKMKIFHRPAGGCIAVTTDRANNGMVKFLNSRGHHVVVCKAQRDWRVSIPNMLKALGLMGVTSILLEGGGELFASFFKAKAIDRIVACIAPKIVGGCGRDFLPGVELGMMKDVVTLDDVEIKRFASDIVVEGRMTSGKKRSSK